MRTRADILRFLIDELEHFECKVEALTRDNEARLLATRAHLHDSDAQIASRSKDPNRPLRLNGSFLR